jgi:glycosyltransferase involved in cell wall biosynthesis
MISSPEQKAFVIIPAFNEQETVCSVIKASLSAQLIDGVVVVDDGSTDKTKDTVFELKENLTNISKPLDVISYRDNRGKSEALTAGVELAKEIGGVTLHSLVFLDADLSPLSSRQTPANSKIGHSLFKNTLESTVLDTEASHNYEATLAQHIDDMVEPVLAEEMIMNIGMQHRTKSIDSLRLLLNWGALGGNRALTLQLWDDMTDGYRAKGLKVEGWEVEAALNTFCRRNRDSDGVKLNRAIGKFVMPDVVNIGSRQKAGSMVGGLVRMANIHSQAMHGFLKFGV